MYTKFLVDLAKLLIVMFAQWRDWEEGESL